MQQQQQQLAPAHPQQQRQGLKALGLSCLSAAAAETATYPIDAVKTQLQLQYTSVKALNPGSCAKPAGAFQLGRQLLRSHGLSGLYAGLSPAVLRHFFYTGTRITLYEQLKLAYANHQRQRQHCTTGSSSSAGSELLPKLLFGLTAGAGGQLVAVPADLIKVQMQGDVRAVVSGRQQQRRFSSISSVAAALVQQLGWRGLWQGGLPAVQRAALVNLGELSTYDSAKQSITQAGLLPQGLPTHLAASICSGLVSALISTPADVIKTRLMYQATATPAAAAPPGFGQGPHSTDATAAAVGGSGVGKAPRQTAAASASQTSGSVHNLSNTGSSGSNSRRSFHAFSSSSSGRHRPGGSAGSSMLVAAAADAATKHTSYTLQQQQQPCQQPSSMPTQPPQLRSWASQAHSAAMPHYRGMWDCAVQTTRQEGFLALYKGFWPTWARLGPWQLVFWVCYEQLRGLAHISSF